MFSMQSHVDELAGGVALLASQAFVDAGRIFALGNSEGTLHVLNYQLHNPAIPLAGLVLTGPPGRAVGAVTRAQLAAQASGMSEGDACWRSTTRPLRDSSRASPLPRTLRCRSASSIAAESGGSRQSADGP